VFPVLEKEPTARHIYAEIFMVITLVPGGADDKLASGEVSHQQQVQGPNHIHRPQLPLLHPGIDFKKFHFCRKLCGSVFILKFLDNFLLNTDNYYSESNGQNT
jgi:hypothetical protein